MHNKKSKLIIGNNGTKYWMNDKIEFHRTDGPAIETPTGEKHWYNDNVFYENKDSFFESLTEAEKEIALFSEDFLNG